MAAAAWRKADIAFVEVDSPQLPRPIVHSSLHGALMGFKQIRKYCAFSDD